MSGAGSKKAERDLKRRGLAAKKAEAQAAAPGSVVVHFREPVHKVPWWRASKADDFTKLYTNSGVASQGEVIHVVSETSAGRVTRLLHWGDVIEVIAIPRLPDVAVDEG